MQKEEFCKIIEANNIANIMNIDKNEMNLLTPSEEMVTKDSVRLQYFFKPL